MTTEHTERITHALVRDIALPDGLGTLALVTLDNGLGPGTPNTLGVAGLTELRSVLTTLADRAAGEDLSAVAVTGAGSAFAAGADLTMISTLTERAQALELARLGHATFRLLGEMDVPTFAFVNGVALGGGLELALHCDYRSVAADVTAIGLPECSLGLVPGWGGTYLLPQLVGLDRALEVILTNSLSGRLLGATQAFQMGIADAVLDPDGFVQESIAWAGRVLSGQVEVDRPALGPHEGDAVLDAARAGLAGRVHPSQRAPWLALDLVARSPDRDRDTAFAAEDDALADLIMTDEMRASVYAFRLTSRGAKHPADAPDPELARPVHQVGVVGAGLMAAQLALLCARRGLPVTMRDLDDERVAAGLAAVRRMVERMTASGRITPADAERVLGSVQGTTDLEDLAGSDLVIEAVTEQLGVKRRVFAELEQLVDPAAVLATNTSALSVEAIAGGLSQPERVVGLHFFNPVAQMPLVEVVRAPQSSDAAVATAFAVVRTLRKTAVGVADRPGFVVNRLLILLLAEVLGAVEDGTPVEVADDALAPLGLPMRPFALLQLVGTGVARHVLQALHEDLGPRYRLSPGLDHLDAQGRPLVLGTGRPDSTSRVDPGIQDAFAAPPEPGRAAEDVLDAVLTALTAEIGRMLDEGVVSGPEQIDLCMTLGAGWPFHLGGICPYLDRTGYSERVLGRRLLAPGVASLP